MRFLVHLAAIFFLFSSSNTLKQFLQRVEHETGKKVYVIQLPQGAEVSRGGFGNRGIYAFMKPGASEEEVAHEVLHSELGLEGFVATRAVSKSVGERAWVGLLSGMVQDFVLHPLLDRRARSYGFPQDAMATAGATFMRQSLLSITGVVRDDNRLHVATSALGFAGVLQRGYGPTRDIRKLAGQKMPKAYALAEKVLRKFHPSPTITATQSYEEVKSILNFLDHETATQGGDAPSQFLRIFNPILEPPLDADQEREIRRDYLGEQ